MGILIASKDAEMAMSSTHTPYEFEEHDWARHDDRLWIWTACCWEMYPIYRALSQYAGDFDEESGERRLDVSRLEFLDEVLERMDACPEWATAKAVQASGGDFDKWVGNCREWEWGYDHVAYPDELIDGEDDDETVAAVKAACRAVVDYVHWTFAEKDDGGDVEERRARLHAPFEVGVTWQDSELLDELWKLAVEERRAHTVDSMLTALRDLRAAGIEDVYIFGEN